MNKLIKRSAPWIVAAFLGVAAVVYGFWPQPQEVETARIVRGDIEATIDEQGETRIREKYIVSAPVSGKLLRVQLHAGDEVTQDATELARIEPHDAALLDPRTQAESEARLRAARAYVRQNESQLDSAAESLKLAASQLKRATALHAKNVIPREQFESAQHAQRIAQADVHTAESGLAIAKFELEHAIAEASRFDGSSNTPIAPFRLVSPIDGVVLNVFQEDAGVVAPGTPLLELGDAQDLEMVIEVLSAGAVSIRPGCKVHVEQWGGRNALEGIVRKVEPAAFLKVSALGVEEKRVNVIADFVAPWANRQTLGDGFRVEASIVFDSRSAVLKVPAGALFRNREKWKVFRVVEGVVELCDVETGLTSGDETEIIGGLVENDVVIVYPSNAIRDGIRVVPSSEP